MPIQNVLNYIIITVAGETRRRDRTVSGGPELQQRNTVATDVFGGEKITLYTSDVSFDCGGGGK